jgi:general stress protein 26
MLTTIDEETGRLRSRPMATQRKEFDGTLWFFTKIASDKVEDVEDKGDVSVTYVNADKNLYIAIQGKATVMRDLEMMEEQWHNGLTNWFPQGLDDPELAIMKVEVQNAEYWDGPDNAVERLVGFVRAVTTGESYQANDNEELPFA